MHRAILAAALLPLPALAAEEVVTIPTERGPVAATLERPEGGPAPVVLMLHGFGGSRDELAVAGTEEGVFSRSAEALAEAGIASLRIDFRGSGDSPGDFADTTFSGQIADAVAAIDWLAEDARVDGDAIGLLGWSQGGLVASHAAGARADLVDATVLWAPVAAPLHSYGALMGDAIARAAAAEPGTPITFTLPWDAEMTLRTGFFDELATTSPPAAMAGYPGPLLVIVGSRDEVVAPQPAAGQVFLNYHEGPERLLVVDADHVWNVFAGPETLDGEMIPASLDWFETHLR
jgi:alpha/beta superfamily hydrolase